MPRTPTSSGSAGSGCAPRSNLACHRPPSRRDRDGDQTRLARGRRLPEDRDPQPRDLGALRDRGLQRARIAQFQRYGSFRTRWACNVNILTCPQRHLAFGAILDPRLTQGSTTRKNQCVGKAAESPFDELSRGFVAELSAVCARDHHHQAPPIAAGRTEEVVSSFASEAGLDAIGTGNDTGNGVVIGLGDPSVAHAVPAEEPGVKLRVPLDHHIGQEGQVFSRGKGLPSIGETVRAAEMAVIHPQLACSGIHPLQPLLHRSVDRYAQDHCGIIGGDGGEAHDEIFDEHRVPGFEEHAGAVAGPELGNLPADLDSPVERQLTIPDHLDFIVAQPDYEQAVVRDLVFAVLAFNKHSADEPLQISFPLYTESKVSARGTLGPAVRVTGPAEKLYVLTLRYEIAAHLRAGRAMTLIRDRVVIEAGRNERFSLIQAPATQSST